MSYYSEQIKQAQKRMDELPKWLRDAVDRDAKKAFWDKSDWPRS